MIPFAPRSCADRAPRGFTLIELLTVIAIIGILAAIIIPVVGKVRDSAKGSKNLSQLRSLATAAQNYAADSKDRLPGIGINSLTRWPMQLFPYMGVPNAKPENAGSLSIYHNTLTPFDDYQTPDGRGNYNGLYGYNKVFMPAAPAPASATDPANMFGVAITKIANPASTIIFGDKFWDWKNAGLPQASQNLDRQSPYPTQPHGLAANWSGKFHASFVDGHVAVLSAHPGENAFLLVPNP